ncbi:hypothetical protein EB796_023247 [Bugula neritina]|uniref:Apple domain-containing protein n=1 Tax=Bugula neritina TaxID=10212 RepID=A0A7J7IWZ3_BUGNE|nr:hypothetical protein EB796_023247 [Bugula neritina]
MNLKILVSMLSLGSACFVILSLGHKKEADPIDECAQRLSTFEFTKQIDDLTALDSTLSTVLLVSKGNLWHCSKKDGSKANCKTAYRSGEENYYDMLLVLDFEKVIVMDSSQIPSVFTLLKVGGKENEYKLVEEIDATNLEIHQLANYNSSHFMASGTQNSQPVFVLYEIKTFQGRSSFGGFQTGTKIATCKTTDPQTPSVLMMHPYLDYGSSSGFVLHNSKLGTNNDGSLNLVSWKTHQTIVPPEVKHLKLESIAEGKQGLLLFFNDELKVASAKVCFGMTGGSHVMVADCSVRLVDESSCKNQTTDCQLDHSNTLTTRIHGNTIYMTDGHCVQLMDLSDVNINGVAGESTESMTTEWLSTLPPFWTSPTPKPTPSSSPNTVTPPSSYPPLIPTPSTKSFTGQTDCGNEGTHNSLKSMIRFRFMTFTDCNRNSVTNAILHILLHQVLHVPAKNMASECGILCTDYPHDCSGFGYTADGDCILFSDSGNMKVKLLNANFERCYIKVEAPNDSC